MALCVLVVLVMGALSACGSTKRYRLPSDSMAPTLERGAHIKVDTKAYDGARPKVGEIVAFHPPAGNVNNTCGAPVTRGQPCARPSGGPAKITFVKRIVAGPGDRVALRKGRVVRNGRLQSEPYVKRCLAYADCDYPRAVVVPAGEWYVLGDNRGESDDSRFWGPVPRDWIIGNAFATYWPPKRIGLL